jgi:hypothetical protein
MLLVNQAYGQRIEFTQGDTVTLYLQATDDQGNPINLTGAALSTQILGPNPNGPVTFGNGQHTLGNQSTNPGTFSLALAVGDTNSCGQGINKDIITESVISGVTTYFRGQNLLAEVYPAIPLQ